MKGYLPAVMASIATGFLLFIYFNKPQQIDHLPPTPSIQQPEKPFISLRAGAEPFGPGIYSSDSLSTIQINNGTSTDVLIKLVNTDKGQNAPVRIVYIPKNASFSIDQLPEGAYKVFYAYGLDWDREKKRFNIRRSYSVADKLLEVRKEVTEADGPNGKQVNTKYGGHRIDLKGTADGNFPAHPIKEDKFNNI